MTPDPSLSLFFEFADSELAPFADSPGSSEAGPGVSVALVFSAASLVDLAGSAVHRPGHAHGLRLVLEGLREAPPPAVWADALGRLREGVVHAEGQSLRRLPLDWRAASGPVRLALLFANGVVVEVEADRAWLERDPGFAVFESLAC